MRVFTLLFSLIIFACKDPVRKELPKIKTNVSIHKIQDRNNDNSGVYKSDTVLFSLEEGDTLRYTPEQFSIVKNYILHLNADFVKDPTLCYPETGIIQYKDSTGHLKAISFSSEVGQDCFYELYAYFLKSRNGEKKFDLERKTIIEIFRYINEIFADLEHGGTYFGHQNSRILGYAEYSISRYARGEYDKSHDISTQKSLYINSLRQLIRNELSADNNNGLSEKDKFQIKHSLMKIVDKLNDAIRDFFYLNSAQEFQYSNY